MRSAVQQVEDLLGIAVIWKQGTVMSKTSHRPLYKAKRNKYEYMVCASEAGLYVHYTWKIYGEDEWGDMDLKADSGYSYETAEEAQRDCEEYANTHGY